jgi:hypothetical protein
VNLGIILTARCNASCTHCSKSYGPRRRESLEKDQIYRLINEAAEIEDGSPLVIELTGGEPFLDFELLVDVTARARSLGAEVSCVTNAYWARSLEKATSMLARLRFAGLGYLSVSVSRFHQQFVPLDRVRIALESAVALGIVTELKGAVTSRDVEPGGALHEWKQFLDADKINIFPVLPCLREGATLPESEYYRESGLPAQACPGEIVCVYTDGVARSCCGPGVSGPFLQLGDTANTSVKEIHRRFQLHAKQRILREAGPIYFAERAIALGFGHRLRASYAGPCDLCGHISTDPELRRIADAAAAALGGGPVVSSGLREDAIDDLNANQSTAQSMEQEHEQSKRRALDGARN